MAARTFFCVSAAAAAEPPHRDDDMTATTEAKTRAGGAEGGGNAVASATQPKATATATATKSTGKNASTKRKKKLEHDGTMKKQKTSGKTPTTSKTVEKWTAGDWACKCGFHNYRKNLKCHRCKTDKPAKLGKKGAWEYLTKWSVMEIDEVDEVHHAWLISQSGIGNEMSDEFFDLFLPYCEGLEDARKKIALKGALKAQARLQQIVEALGGDKKSDESEEDSDSDSDGEEKVTTVVVKKPKKRRGKRGKGKGGKGGGGATAPTENAA